MIKRKAQYTFDAGDVRQWRYCPKCGAEILEVYAGDWRGYLTCAGGEDTCDIDFGVKYEEEVID